MYALEVHLDASEGTSCAEASVRGVVPKAVVAVDVGDLVLIIVSYALIMVWK